MHKYAIGGALLLAATHGAALSLGGTQGGVIIGRPLDILIKANANAADTSEGLCLEADVQYGETRLVPSLVSVAVQKLADDGSGTVRVRTTQPVNEPIVTLTVRAGCTQKYTRSYTLLADFEPIPMASSREAVMSRLPDVPPARVATTDAPARPSGSSGDAGAVAVDAVPSPIRLPAPTRRPAGVTSMTTKTRPVAVPVARVDAAAKPAQPPAKADKPTPEAATTPAPAPVMRKAAPAPAEAPATPRLKLDPIDVTAPVAASAPPPAPVQDVSPESKKLKDMEQELRGMREQQARLQATLETMNAQLARSQDQRYNNPLVYGLAGLAALAVAGMGWVVLRQRREQTRKSVFPWWADSTGFPSELPSVLPAPVQAPAPAAVPHPAEASQAAPVSTTAPAAPALDDVYTALPTEGFEVREPETLVLPEAGAGVVLLSFDVLADLTQHVEFFDSLGHWADAVAHIDAFLQRYPASSDLPYLLRLRHAVMEDDEAAIQATQEQYLKHFPHPGPTAYDYGVLAPGLPLDTPLLERICKAWPGADARRLIEDALVSRPGDEHGLQDRNLESFNELFFLHSLLDTLESLPAVVPVAAEPVADPGWTSVAEVVRAPTASDPTSPSAVPAAEVASIDIDFSGFDSITTPAGANADAVDTDAEKRELPPLDFNMADFGLPNNGTDQPKKP